MGVLQVDGRRQGGVFTELDLELLEALADHTAVVVGSLKSERPIRELLSPPAAALDRVGSRSFLEDLAQRVEEVARAARVPRPTL
jgi:hypothetical protein